MTLSWNYWLGHVVLSGWDVLQAVEMNIEAPAFCESVSQHRWLGQGASGISSKLGFMGQGAILAPVKNY